MEAELAACRTVLHFRRQHTDEVADAAGGFENVPLSKAHALHHLVNALNDLRWGVERCQNTLPCRVILIGCQNVL